jgi:hypothetical protein
MRMTPEEIKQCDEEYRRHDEFIKSITHRILKIINIDENTDLFISDKNQLFLYKNKKTNPISSYNNKCWIVFWEHNTVIKFHSDKWNYRECCNCDVVEIFKEDVADYLHLIL